jgi:hypothetical protein
MISAETTEGLIGHSIFDAAMNTLRRRRGNWRLTDQLDQESIRIGWSSEPGAQDDTCSSILAAGAHPSRQPSCNLVGKGNRFIELKKGWAPLVVTGEPYAPTATYVPVADPESFYWVGIHYMNSALYHATVSLQCSVTLVAGNPG